MSDEHVLVIDTRDAAVFRYWLSRWVCFRAPDTVEGEVMRHKKCPACGADMLFGDAMPWGWPERSQVNFRTKLSSLAVHRRFLKALDTAGVRTVGDCYERGTRGLLMIDNFGRKGLNQIGAALMAYRGGE